VPSPGSPQRACTGGRRTTVFARSMLLLHPRLGPEAAGGRRDDVTSLRHSTGVAGGRRAHVALMSACCHGSSTRQQMIRRSRSYGSGRRSTRALAVRSSVTRTFGRIPISTPRTRTPAVLEAAAPRTYAAATAVPRTPVPALPVVETPGPPPVGVPLPTRTETVAVNEPVPLEPLVRGCPAGRRTS